MGDVSQGKQQRDESVVPMRDLRNKIFPLRVGN